jgi:hypothetical protein
MSWLDGTKIRKSSNDDSDEGSQLRNVFGVFYKHAAELTLKTAKTIETKLIEDNSDDKSSMSSETRVAKAKLRQDI